jgi:hypothetical protein
MHKIFIFFSFLLTSTFALAQNEGLPSPTNLQAEFITENDTNYIVLKWNEVSVKERNVGYNVFTNFPPEEKLFLNGQAGVVWKESYKIPVFNNTSQTFRIAVCSIVNFPKVVRSEMSEIIEITTPTTELPLLQLSNFNNSGKSIKLEWNYTDKIPDLKGFELIINGEVNATADADQRSLSYEFEENNTYEIFLQAVTNNGVRSNKTQMRKIIIN